jgi:hypothetical protein
MALSSLPHICGMTPICIISTPGRRRHHAHNNPSTRAIRLQPLAWLPCAVMRAQRTAQPALL